MLLLHKTQWGRKTPIKIYQAGCKRFFNKVLLKNKSISLSSSGFQLSNKYELLFFKCYLVYFSLCYIFWDWAWEAMNPELPPLTKTINTGYVETYTSMNVCLLLTDVILLCIFKIFKFGNKLLIYNKICFLKRHIPHSVSHPLRSQDSMSKSIQPNTEMSKSGWRWVYLRFLSFSIPSSLPFFFIFSTFLRITFRKFLCLTTTIAILATFYKRS